MEALEPLQPPAGGVPDPASQLRLRRVRAGRLLGGLLLCLLASAVAGSIQAARADSSSPHIGPTPDPAAVRFCLSQAGVQGKPQVVDGIRVVAVCVENYQYMPGDNNVAPCPGYVGSTPLSKCADVATAPAMRLEVPQGTQLLFVVPDPNMHTLTFIDCPNVYEDPPSPDPAGAFNLAVGTAEEAAFGPDQIQNPRGKCLFDSYPENGGKVPATAGTGAFQGPGYETVDTSHLPPGTYGFYCQVHAFMRGTLIVDRGDPAGQPAGAKAGENRSQRSASRPPAMAGAGSAMAAGPTASPMPGMPSSSAIASKPGGPAPSDRAMPAMSLTALLHAAPSAQRASASAWTAISRTVATEGVLATLAYLVWLYRGPYRELYRGSGLIAGVRRRRVSQEGRS